MKVKPARKKNRVTVEMNQRDPDLLAAAGAARKNLAIKQILVPVDFSNCSLKALTYAVAFARQFKAAITVLYVVQPYYVAGDYAGGLDYATLEQEIEENSTRRLKELAKEVIGASAKYTVLIERGRPVDEIARTADELNIDLIIISTHGHTGLKHVVLGSTAENVVRHAPCPVLTVRVEEHEFVDS
jgi:nucleotide-binding universal stress UspA family protein